MTKQEKLAFWQERFERAETAYNDEAVLFDARERLVAGERRIKELVDGDDRGKTPHVRNICAELIEAQVDSTIPMPKVTAMREGDEEKAKIIEDMLRAELDRLPIEEINDMLERTVPIQGGAFYHCEWDNSETTHQTIGEIVITPLHPKQVVPQDGIYTGIEDMDYIFLKIPQTKEYLRRRYNKDVSFESESDPGVKGVDEGTAEDLVTQIIVYFRNEMGGIGLFSFVGDTVLEDLDDYQARRTKKCIGCGNSEPSGAVHIDSITGEETSEKVCPHCGGREFAASDDDFEEVWQPIMRQDGSQIGGAKTTAGVDESGEVVFSNVGEKIPYYKPNIYPVIMQKNVSSFGKFLGESDIDKVADQQNTINRMEAKIIDKLCRSGSYLTLPPNVDIESDGEDMKVIRVASPSDISMISVQTVEGDISQDMAYLSQIYEEAKQAIGVTESFLGRIDNTATSGKAKEFSASQAAGRIESKRVMKRAGYAHLYEAIFKFKLAYADEPRPVPTRDINGNIEYKRFDRYDFLEIDSTGSYYWNDRFLFSCDTSSSLAQNREAMWQETRQNLQTGAFGDPSDPETLLLFWNKMERLHYPDAAETKRYIESRIEAQKAQAAQMQTQIENRAMEDAMRDASVSSAIPARAL